MSQRKIKPLFSHLPNHFLESIENSRLEMDLVQVPDMVKKMEEMDIFKPIIYLAGPAGFSVSSRNFLAGLTERLIGIGYSKENILNPWILSAEEGEKVFAAKNLKQKQKLEEWFWPRAGLRNEIAISISDVVSADLSGTDVDGGTGAEIGYAYALAKTILGYRDDFRLSGEVSVFPVSLQVSHFVLKSPNGNVSWSIEDHLKDFKKFLKGFKRD